MARTVFNQPLIGVIMCQIERDGQPVQMVLNNYAEALASAGAAPVALPHILASRADLTEDVMSVLDGILLTGSPSNIEPCHYGEPGSEPHADPGRDKLAFTLINTIIARQMPLLAICRGLQELVVATGGSLHRQLHLHPGFQEHREDTSLTLAGQYADAHQVWLESGGVLARLAEGRKWLWVNSLHQQGIRHPGPQLCIEARASDGLIEAVSLRRHPFALAVQWHPEWHYDAPSLSHMLFAGFVHACHQYQQNNKLPAWRTQLRSK